MGFRRAKVYAFRYERPYGLNPIWEKTHTLITEIIGEVKNSALSSDEIESFGPLSGLHEGNYSSGNRTGVITTVLRWGMFGDTVCSINLNMGGHGSQGAEEDLFFNIYNEEGCQLAERLILDPREVQLDYTQDNIEFWDDNDHFVKNMTVLSGHLVNYGESSPSLASDGVVNSDSRNGLAFSATQMREIRKRLLNDPKFIEEVRKKIMGSNPEAPANP